MDSATLRELSALEDRFAARIAERGLACADEADKRILRTNYMIARNRADVFMELALEAENATIAD